MRGNVNINQADRDISFSDYIACALDGQDRFAEITPEQLEETQKLWGLK